MGISFEGAMPRSFENQLRALCAPEAAVGMYCPASNLAINPSGNVTLEHGIRLTPSGLTPSGLTPSGLIPSGLPSAGPPF